MPRTCGVFVLHRVVDIHPPGDSFDRARDAQDGTQDQVRDSQRMGFQQRHSPWPAGVVLD